MHIAPRVIMLFLLMAQVAGMAAECPSSDSLYQRIYHIATAALPSNQERLQQLLAFKEETKPCQSRNDSAYAYLLRRIGLAYGQIGDFRKAIEYTKQAIGVIVENSAKASINMAHLPLCYYNLQAYYDSTHQEVLKREAIDSCIAVDFRIGGTYYYSSYLISDKISFLHNQGDYIYCLNYASFVEKLFQNADSNQLKARCATLIYHANILIILKRYQEALDLLNREMPTFKARSEYIGSVYTLLGVINIYIGSFKKALDHFYTSIEFNKKISHHPGIAEAYHWMGFVHAQRLNQPANGLLYYRKGLKYADATDAVPILSDIGKTYTKLDLFDSAFHSFQLAFDKIKPGSNENTVIHHVLDEQSDETTLNYVTTLLINKADAYLKYYKVKRDKMRLANAINVYKNADKLLNNLQSLHLELASKLFWRDNTRELYENAIEASYLIGSAEDAFYFFERSRAAILNAELYQQRWIPEKEMIKLSGLKKQIYLQERALSETDKTTTRYVHLQKETIQQKEQLERMQQQVKQRYPLYYQRYIDSSTITIKDVQGTLLRHHHALVELFHGDSSVFVLIVEKQNAVFKKIDKDLYEQLSKKFIDYLSDGEQINAAYDDFVNLSHQLYKVIFQTATVPSGRIIFSPDRKYFPFEALVTSTKPTVYFLEDHAVSYTYSVRYLLQDHGQDIQSNNASFFGIAPIRFNAGWQLSVLNGSDESLQRIDNHFSKSTNLLAAQATRRNFLDKFDSYRIIQLYTHATDSGTTGEPMIYFADSTLALSELIYGSKPITGLVVLAACQTGLGKFYNGEGVFNFNRGFAAMGVPASISNLWLIETKATYRLTELFYKHLANGKPADVALQAAKKEFMREGESRRNQLPYLWAASILVGDSEFTIEQKVFPWRWVLILVPAIIVLVWWRRKPSVKRA